MSWLLALAGGVLIGAAASLLLIASGRVAGVSGIVGSLLPPAAPDRSWRLAFVAGLGAPGIVAALAFPHAIGPSVRSLSLMVIAGLLVGFGTRLGGGCTSGHGVCGVSRLSVRSLVATGVFIATGVVTVIVLRVAS